MKNSKNEFNTTIDRMYAVKNGYWSMPITSEIYDALQQAELGGRFVVKVMTEGQRKTDKSPHAYLEYMSKEKVKEFEVKRAEYNRNKQDKEELE